LIQDIFAAMCECNAVCARCKCDVSGSFAAPKM
jgi:hypothetical protein